MLIIVCFSVLKKSRILIAILGFLSTLKRTIISAFVSLLFINGIIPPFAPSAFTKNSRRTYGGLIFFANTDGTKDSTIFAISTLWIGE